MKKLGVGEIVRGGGFSATLREVQETGQPIFITKGNEVIAMLAPCNDATMNINGDMQAVGRVIALLSERGDAALSEYLVHQLAIGYLAKTLLIGLTNAQVVADLESKLAERLMGDLQRVRAEDSATVGTDMSAVSKGDKGRRKKPAARS